MPTDGKGDGGGLRTPGQAAYEAHMQPERFNHPRLGQRVCTWDEIAHLEGEQARWESVAQAAIEAAPAPSALTEAAKPGGELWDAVKALNDPEGQVSAMKINVRGLLHSLKRRPRAEYVMPQALGPELLRRSEEGIEGLLSALDAAQDRLQAALTVPPRGEEEHTPAMLAALVDITVQWELTPADDDAEAWRKIADNKRSQAQTALAKAGYGIDWNAIGRGERDPGKLLKALAEVEGERS